MTGRLGGFRPGGCDGSSNFQLVPVPPTMTAGVVSSLVSGEVLRSRHRLETEKSLHLPVVEVLLLLLLLVVVEVLVVEINMVTSRWMCY